jgi:hypothetical protein
MDPNPSARCAGRLVVSRLPIPGRTAWGRSLRIGPPFRGAPGTHRSGDDSYHKLGPRKFAEVHTLNIQAIVARLSTRPFIRVEFGAFVGRFGDREHELGTTAAGLARAVRRLSELRREREAEVP